MVPTTFDAFLQRVYEATGIRTQNELAAALGVNRSAITQARKKNSIPAKWSLGLYRAFGLNPDWIETGIGPTFLNAAAVDESAFEQVPKVRARLCAGDGSFEVGAEIGFSLHYSALLGAMTSDYVKKHPLKDGRPID